MGKRTGAQIIVHLLERQGIQTVAGIPGGANLPLYDALGQSAIRHVLVRHEQAAGFMAQGMARVTGRPQVCLATSGPGAVNLLTAVADAMLDSVPIVCITGQVPAPLIGTDAFQEVDVYGMSIPITKHNYLVRSVEELLEVIPEAFRIAASGRPGPVLVDVPKDVQAATMDVEQWPEPGRADAPPAADALDMERAAAMLDAAARPVLYLGGGVANPRGAAAATALAERVSAPAVMTLMGLGVMPLDHPLALGMLGMHAAPYTNRLLEECDLLVAAGVRFDDRATGRLDRFCPDAKVIHVDIDPGELGKLRRPHVAMAGDAAGVLEGLLRSAPARRRTAWLERVASMRRDHAMRVPRADDPSSPYGLVLETARRAGPGAIVCTDVGQHQMRVAQVHPHLKPRRWLTSGGLGTMGFGLPTAMGAALADPEAIVTCFSGDGSLMMNIQELATLAEHGLNVKVVLMNNNCLGLVHQQQELFYGGRYTAVRYGNHVDFPALAKGFGLRSVDLARAPDVPGALAEALAQPGPCLIHAPCDAAEGVYPMVPPGAANCEMIEEVRHERECA